GRAGAGGGGGRVERDAVEPGEELLALVEGADLSVEGEKGVLGRFFRVLGVAKNAVGEGVDPAVVALDHLLEGLRISSLDASHEVEVGFLLPFTHGVTPCRCIWVRILPGREWG